jgi:hypothetical protein
MLGHGGVIVTILFTLSMHCGKPKMKRFLNWLADKIAPQKASPKPRLNQTGQFPARKKVSVKQAIPKSQPEYVDFDATVDGKIDDAGPGKNILRRSKFIREDTGTHETLSILDDSAAAAPDPEEGIDPYNTGQFDRSKNWDNRFRND